MKNMSKAAAAAVSVTYNVVLIAAKLVAAIVTGSVAMLSEALNSTMDPMSCILASLISISSFII